MDFLGGFLAVLIRGILAWGLIRASYFHTQIAQSLTCCLSIIPTPTSSVILLPQNKDNHRNRANYEATRGKGVVWGLPLGGGSGAKRFATKALEAAIRDGVALEPALVRPWGNLSRPPQPQLTRIIVSLPN